MIELNDWLSIDKTSGEGNDTITLNASVLEDFEDRGTSITIKTSTKSVVLNLNQVFPDYPPNNQIWYTSSDGYSITPYQTGDFNVKILSNRYENGLGIITFADDITSIGEDAFNVYGSRLTSIMIPDSVITIEPRAFKACSLLTNVHLGNSVTTINGSAFYECISLTEINIPNSVTTIGGSAFWKCSSLVSISIPDSVTSIGSGAFTNCYGLTNISLGNGLTELSDGVFSYCTSLVSITIPDSVTVFKRWVFQGCSSLFEITIPNSVTDIGYGSFEDCSALNSVTFGEGVTLLRDYIFKRCNNLSTITCKGMTAPRISDITFWGINSNGTLYYPQGSDYSTWFSVNGYTLYEYNWTGVPY